MHKLYQNKDQLRSVWKTGADFGATELGFLPTIINGFDFPYPLIGKAIKRFSIPGGL